MIHSYSRSYNGTFLVSSFVTTMIASTASSTRSTAMRRLVWTHCLGHSLLCHYDIRLGHHTNGEPADVALLQTVSDVGVDTAVLLWGLVPDAQNKVQIVQRVVGHAAMICKALMTAASGQFVKIMSFHPTNKAAVVGLGFSF